MEHVVIQCCSEPELTDYWHENDACDDEMCYAVECESCHEWQASCGMNSKDTE